MRNENAELAKLASLCIGLLLMLIAIPSLVYPVYRVWSASKRGEAALAEADQNRKIAIAEAQAKLDASKALAQADVERARGVAEANKIIGDSLKENEAYLRYLWIEGLQTNQMQVIYVPTEAGLPILEAGKR